MSDLVVAIDLGTSKVACVVAEPGANGELTVLSLAYGPSAGVDRGTIIDEAAARASVDSVVGKVERHLGTTIDRVWCSLGGPHLESVNGQAMLPIYPAARAIKRQDMHQVLTNSRKLLMPPDREQVLALPKEFLLDGQRGIANPEGLRGTRLEVVTNIVMGQSKEIAKTERCCAGDGRRIVGMVPAGLASGLGVLSQEMMEMGTVVVDIGAGKTDVAVFADGVMAYCAVVKVGAEHYTNDIAQLLKTDFDEADRLKVEHGSTLPGPVDAEETVAVLQEGQSGPRPMKRKMLCEILGSRGAEHARIVRAKIEESGVEAGQLKSVVLTGGGSLLDGSKDVFEEILGIGRPRIVQPKVAGAFSKQVASPILSTVVGVARYALESGDDDFAPVSGLSSWKERISTLGKKLGFGEKS